MMKMIPEGLIQQLSTVVDPALARLTIESYMEMQQRFLAGDWKPAELDGGRLCEAVSRCLLQFDTGEINHKKLPRDVREVLIDEKQKYTHALGQQDRHHIAKVIEAIYKLRSDRGPVHISPIYTANHMDSMLVLHAGKWIFAELLRLALQQDRKVVGAIIEQLVQMEHSIIHELDGKPMVLAKNATAPEEILVLLYHAANNRLSRVELREQARHKPNNVGVAISRLTKEKDVRIADNGDIALTPNGEKRIREVIMPKLAPKK